MEVLLAGIGGIAGSLSRFIIGRYFSSRIKNFPVGTFIINITGAILLGLVNALNLPSELHYLLAVGYLGAYTTFSTFMYEGFSLFKGKRSLDAFIYIVLSITLGVPGVMLGAWMGRFLVQFLK